MPLIDTHAHLTDERFAGDLEQVIAHAQDAGVEKIIVCGYDIESSVAACELSDKYPIITATAGVHPHDSKHYDADSRRIIMELCECGKSIAVGEIGLDYHYDFSPRDDQHRAFADQLALAIELGLPVVIHTRESDDDTLKVIRGVGSNSKLRGVFHCFSGDVEMARTILDMGFYIGVDGPVTYKSAGRLKKVVEYCPIERILVETDCPYMAPAPERGHRNEPAFVDYVARAIAQIKEMDYETVCEATTRNARELFGLEG